MAVQVDSIHLNSLSKMIAFRTSKMHNLPIQGGEELPKALRKSNESKKMCSFSQSLQNHGGEELLKTLRKRIEKMNMMETKSKPKIESKKICICAPTSHEGSFKCRYHRISEANKSRTDKKLISLSFSSKSMHELVDFRSSLSRFGKAMSAEVAHHSQRQPSALAAA